MQEVQTIIHDRSSMATDVVVQVVNHIRKPGLESIVNASGAIQRWAKISDLAEDPLYRREIRPARLIAQTRLWGCVFWDKSTENPSQQK